MSQKRRPRVLSGMRPTGPLHLGHLVGALDNWVEMQDDHDCFFAIVDWHALTTDYADPSQIRQNTREIALDWLAAGLDPERCQIFVQSDVPEHAELHLLLSMIVPISWLERVPTYKEQQEALRERELNTYGFLGYPLLQAADILIYRANQVPVGEDQVPHLELTREIARRFNHLYKKTFPEPQPKLTRSPRLPGTDGRKMSKSYGNAIFLGDTPKQIGKKLAGMLTDPQRTHRHLPGNPDVCPVFDTHKVFSSDETLAWADAGCRSAEIGCVDCKGRLRDRILERVGPIGERRRELADHPEQVDEILAAGAETARRVAGSTMVSVRKAMKVHR
ncbi:MAG: tryptophan--tRNA ligase [Acidobacteriota bacterium]|nr:tryptophan--tRNA ligase [Acidobacteriota bacterium]MDH3785282.1 tryptophan--tRNA ligase [Acidobacteriota bacterium]